MKVAVITPNAADRALAVDLLALEGVAAAPMSSLRDVSGIPHDDLGCVIVVEEALTDTDVETFRDAIAAQPPWSDLPLILLAGQDTSVGSLLGRIFPESGNIALLQRPVHPVGLASAVKVALRARARQYQTRDLLAERAAALRRRDEFLAMLAHELRNPLAPIRTAVHLLQTIPAGDPRVAKMQGIIEKQTSHMARLVDDLLDVSRLELGKIELRLQTTDLNACAHAAVDAASPAITSQGHTVHVQTSRDRLPIRVDPVRIEQVLSNLILNAAKFTRAGGTITLRTFQEGGMAVAQVEDTGIGIKPENLRSVFDLFVQGETTLARTSGGLGIGLTLVKRLVEVHGGKVHLESGGDMQGTRVEVRLPLARDATITVTETAASVAPAAPQKVLIVEDSGDIRDTLGMLLEQWQHEVAFAQDGPEGVATAIAWNPDVALIDIGLPGFSGYEVAKQIRAADSPWSQHVRLIALTGYGQPADREIAMQAGFDLHLLKPVDPMHLQRVLAGDAHESER